METKDHIINTAFKILSKEGPKSLTTSRLIEEADISKGGLYHHFENIEQIYLSVLQMLTESLTEGFYELEFKDVDHLNDVLVETFFDDLEDHRDVYSSIFYFMSSSNNNPEYKCCLKDWSEKNLKKWGSLYNKFYDNKIDDQKIDFFMRMIDMYFGGVIMHEYILEDKHLYKKITRDFLSLVTNELKS